MLTITRSEPLHKQLESGAVRWEYADDRVSAFLPESVIRDKITKDSIVANLPWSSWLSTRLSLSDSLADKIHEQARKVFAVLAVIGQEHSISDLIYNDNITDNDLPLKRRRPNESVLVPKDPPPGATVKEFSSFSSWDDRRVREFLDQQWLVLAPVLDVAGQSLNLDPRCPLPIKEIELRVKGHGVFVHKATLHPAHQLWSDEVAKPGSPVAIKEIHDEAIFTRERGNLEQIQNIGHPHLIKLLTSCKKGAFCCFIFPWADGGNLWDFWAREDTAQRDTGFVLWMLDQVNGIIDAIRVLHDKNIRHGDIKPQNILHFTGTRNGGRGLLVLADVGVSKIHKNDTLKRNAATDTVEVTVLYEAPEAEYDRKEGRPRSRRYDMWSSGCMLLEFIVWLLYGFGAVRTFRSRRISSKDDPTTAPGNFFRQKKGQIKIHSVVRKAMELLRADPRCGSGTALAGLLDMIENRLLQIEPKDRAEAPELCDKLRELVDKSKDDPSFLWKGTDASIETPRFFVRKSRQNSDSSVASSGSSSSAASSGSSGWMNQPSTGGSLDSVDSVESR